MKKRYSEEQIIGAIRRQKASAKASGLCRELGISMGTFYNRRSKCGGLDVNEAKRLPASIVSDNGPEFTGKAMFKCAEENGTR